AGPLALSDRQAPDEARQPRINSSPPVVLPWSPTWMTRIPGRGAPARGLPWRGPWPPVAVV
ncbi:MAG: hypothetical protein OXG70_06440, partial [Cyanobacteria bacterium MAG IRC1_bin_28]|nr:hypothetical protein [Cyanobacteria bacterium MAG IRC1_bin_28]